jgi:hypothetical protein
LVDNIANRGITQLLNYQLSCLEKLEIEKAVLRAAFFCCVFALILPIKHQPTLFNVRILQFLSTASEKFIGFFKVNGSIDYFCVLL